MNIENLSIEELQALIRDFQAEFYELDERKAQIMSDVSILKARIEELVAQSSMTMEASQEENTNTEVQENTTEEAVVEAPQEEPVNAQAEVEETQTTPVDANTQEEVAEQANVTPLIPTVEETNKTEDTAQEQVAETESAVVTPLIPVIETKEVSETPVEESKEETNIQALDETPATSEVQNAEVKEDFPQFVKSDSNPPRPIMVTEMQAGKLRKSVEQQESITLNSFNNNEVVAERATTTPLIPTVDEANKTETPAQGVSNENSAVVTPLMPTVDVSEKAEEVYTNDQEGINKQLEAMIEQLKVTTDEAKAAEINSKISELSEKAKVLEKAA